MLTSSRDNWERLVAAVVKRQQIWELCHQQSRTPSICSTITSDDFSEQNLSDLDPFSLPPSPLLPYKYSSNQVKTTRVRNNASSQSITRLLSSTLYRRRISKDQFLLDIPAEEDPVLKVHLGQFKRFSLEELQVATDNFSNKNILGRGSFGKIYKGRLTDGSLVSVKRLREDRTPDGKLQFRTEVEISSMAVHRNLRRLCGFCITLTERLLIYPYMANGSVAFYLSERPQNVAPLDWKTRKRIALGSARGLSYLHDQCGRRIVHRDVKAGHIFLDEEYEAVVGDFSLAILMDSEYTHVTTSVRGTTGHIDPDYLSTGKVSVKADVFGYGIMLLELITGRRAYDLPRLENDDVFKQLDTMGSTLQVKELFKEKKLETWVDYDIKNNYVEAEVEQLIQVAVLCCQSSPKDRPKMSEVVRMLEGNGLAEKWDKWQKGKEPILWRICLMLHFQVQDENKKKIGKVLSVMKHNLRITL